MKIWHALVASILFLAVYGCSSGPAAPDVDLYALGTTKPVKLSSFKGKPVVIDFWATWCGPCRETMPELQKIYDEFKPKGLQVVAISSDSAPTIEKFLKDNPYTYPIYVDLDGGAELKFKVDALPTTFVLDRGGNVIWSGHPGDTAKFRQAVEAAVG